METAHDMLACRCDRPSPTVATATGRDKGFRVPREAQFFAAYALLAATHQPEQHRTTYFDAAPTCAADARKETNVFFARRDAAPPKSCPLLFSSPATNHSLSTLHFPLSTLHFPLSTLHFPLSTHLSHLSSFLFHLSSSPFPVPRSPVQIRIDCGSFFFLCFSQNRECPGHTLE